MGQQLNFNSEVLWKKGRSENKVVVGIRPETKWSNHEQIAGFKGKTIWRIELVYVAQYWDDLWLGVKG